MRKIQMNEKEFKKLLEETLNEISDILEVLAEL